MADAKDKAPETVEVKTDSLDKVAIAIQSMVAANQAKSLPMFGLAPTDEKGKPIDPHCIYVERDGKEYPCVIEGARFNPRSWPTGKEDPMSKNIKDQAHCVAFYVRVNFKVKKADNWIPISGVYALKDLRANPNRKQHLKLTPELEKRYALTKGADGKVVLPEGVTQ